MNLSTVSSSEMADIHQENQEQSDDSLAFLQGSESREVKQDESIGEKYKKESKRRLKEKRVDAFREKMMAEIHQTQEALDNNHPFYQEISQIISTLKPGAEFDLIISVDHALKACTLADKKTILISAGLLTRLDDYLKSKGKVLKRDHLAFILAHELSHWDSQADVIHLNETYCDTNGMMMAGRAGYSIDCSVEALEFLQSLEEKEEEKADDEDKAPRSLPITHPSDENRRILGQVIANDADVSLDGRYATAQDFDEKNLQDFFDIAQAWEESNKSRNVITSENQLLSELASAQTASQLLEIALSADDFYHCLEVRKLAQSEQFGNLLLAFAVIVSLKQGYRSSFMAKDDLIAQYKLQLFTDEETPSILPRDLLLPFGVDSEAEHQMHRRLDPDQLDVIRRCLRGEFADPLSILSGEQVPPELVNVNLDYFYASYISQVNALLKPTGTFISDGFNSQRGKVLGVDQLLESSEYLVADGGVNTQVVEKRRALLESQRMLLASVLLRNYHNDDIDSSFEVEAFRNLVIQESPLEVTLPPHQQLFDALVNKLLEVGHCRTSEAAHDLAIRMLGTGKYIKAEQKALNEHDVGLPGYYHSAAFNSEDPQTLEDVAQAMFAHFALTQGGEELGLLVGRPGVNEFVTRINSYFGYICEDFHRKKIEVCNPYSIYAHHYPSLEVPYQSSAEDRGYVTFELENEIFKTAGSVKRRTFDTSAFNKNLEVPTTDPNLLAVILFETTDSGHRRKAYRAFCSNQEIMANVSLVRDILMRGIQNYDITPAEINQILNEVNDAELYQEFLPFISTENLATYYTNWWEQFITIPENVSLSLPLQIASFVEVGGAVCLSGVQAKRGAPVLNNIVDSSNSGFSQEETGIAVDRIMSYQTSFEQIFDRETILEIIDVAAWLKARSLGLKNPSDSFREVGDFGNGITSFEQLLDLLAEIPESPYRDSYLVAVLGMRQEVAGYNSVVDTIDLETAKRALRLLTLDRLTKLDIYNRPPRIPPYLTSLPIDPRSTDIAMRFSFYDGGYDGFLQGLSWFALSEADEMRGKNGISPSVEAWMEELRTIASIIRYPSGSRDYVFETILLPLFNSESRHRLLVADKIKVLEQAWELAYTPRTKDMLAKQLVTERLNQFEDQIDYELGIRIIIHYLPHPSAARDEFIDRILNSTDTTWQQIDESRELIQGHSYRTDEKASAAHSGVAEALTYGIEQLSVTDRTQLLLFLIDISKHVLDEKKITPEFFGGFVKQKLKVLALQSSFDITDQEFEDNYEVLTQYIASLFNNSENRSLGNQLPRNLSFFANRLSGLNLLSLATPTALNEFLTERISGPREGRVTATSLGDIFFGTSLSERRRVIYSLCLGENGFFEDDHFETSGQELLSSLIDTATQRRQGEADEEDQNSWTQEEIETLKKSVIATFSALSPARRTELISKFINYVAESKGQVKKHELMKIGLLSFGAVGPKLGQMDALMPKDFVTALSDLKEDVPPIPKGTIAKILKDAGRDTEYEALGPIIAGGSTAVVVLAKSKGSLYYDRAIKVIRPDVKKTNTEDMNATKAGILAIADHYRVDPQQTMAELAQMVAEELDPTYEKSNTKVLHQARRRLLRSDIQTPEVFYAGPEHIELSLAPGLSLKKIIGMRISAETGQTTSSDAESFRNVDLVEVYSRIVADFFGQVFKLGLFHSDLHEANIFCTTDGTTTEIDHGQMGEEPSRDRRRALLNLTLGIAVNNMGLIYNSLQVFSVDISREVVENSINSNEDILGSLTKLLSTYKVEGSVNRYLKALVNVLPYIRVIQKERPRELAKMLIPYMSTGEIVKTGLGVVRKALVG